MTRLIYWIKILALNITLLIGLLIFLEISAGIARLVLGKPFLLFLIPFPIMVNIHHLIHVCK